MESRDDGGVSLFFYHIIEFEPLLAPAQSVNQSHFSPPNYSIMRTQKEKIDRSCINKDICTQKRCTRPNYMDQK